MLVRAIEPVDDVDLPDRRQAVHRPTLVLVKAASSVFCRLVWRANSVHPVPKGTGGCRLPWSDCALRRETADSPLEWGRRESMGTSGPSGPLLDSRVDRLRAKSGLPCRLRRADQQWSKNCGDLGWIVQPPLLAPCKSLDGPKPWLEAMRAFPRCTPPISHSIPSFGTLPAPRGILRPVRADSSTSLGPLHSSHRGPRLPVDLDVGRGSHASVVFQREQQFQRILVQ